MLHTTATTATSWNGPTCPTCGTRYLDTHACTTPNLLRRIGELEKLLPGAPPNADRTATCPCRPENGGSGVCGCILSGPAVTC